MLSVEQRNAINAALRGNRAPMDEMELAALPMLVRPHYADGEFYLPAPSWQAGMVLWPTDIARGAGPKGETLVTWRGVIPCSRCWLAISRRATCRKCGGRGHLSWEDEVYTNLDGLILGHGDGSPIL